MKFNLYYFAQLREVIGVNQEQIDCPEHVTTVASLRTWMAGRGVPYADAFAANQTVRCALNRTMALDTQVLISECEIAFFPPVTGG